MIKDGKLFFAVEKHGEAIGEDILLNPRMANRHGFICGATGTGKTVTLKVLAESFSAMGVPVFISDVKGDVAGIMKPGTDSESMHKRIEKFHLTDFSYRGCPTVFYDIYGEKGIPLRTTVSEIGPLLMGRILDLNDTQASLLSVIFKIADDHQLLLIDTKDLKAILNYAYENASELEMEYGHIAKASVSAMIRSIVALEAEGGDQFFGEPAIDIHDFFIKTADGYGLVNILDSETLINKPRLYSAFMLYLLSELFEVLPEIGDPEKPKMVFFFDEAHLLFNNASPILLEQINQVVKLIRSKGVGVYFVTQNPADIPGSVLSQLSNKIQHALRAYTPTEIKAVKAAAESFRVNPEFNTAELLQKLGTGEAVVSLLDETGVPTVSKHACILPPQCSLETISDDERQEAIRSNIFYAKYAESKDEDSAYEFLMRRKKEKADEDLRTIQDLQQQQQQMIAEQKELKEKEQEEIRQQKEKEKAEKQAKREQEKAEKEALKEKERAEKQALKEQEKALAEAQKKAEKELKEKEREIEKQKKAQKAAAKTVASSVTGTLGREVGKAVGSSFGSFGKTLGGNLGASLGRSILNTLFKN